MKITDKTKRKAAAQRLKRIKSYYRAYDRGDSIYDRKLAKHVILGKYQLDDEFYLIIQNMHGELLLQKLVYNGSVDVVNVSTTGRQYAKNKAIFDSWFEQVEEYIYKQIHFYYRRVTYGTRFKEKNYVLAIKKEYNGEFYFILRDQYRRYFVAKLSWSWYTDVRVNIISTKEYNENKTVFNSWINEASLKDKR